MESNHRDSTNNARSKQPRAKIYKVRGARRAELPQFNAGELEQLVDMLDLVDVPHAM